jgi:hypothetical protein
MIRMQILDDDAAAAEPMQRVAGHGALGAR